MSTSTIVALLGESPLEALRDMAPDAAPCLEGDPSRFHPLPDNETPELAALLCAGCPVQRGCATQAVAEGHDSGIWGGMTAAQRRDVAPLLRATAQRVARPRPPQAGQLIELHEPMPRRCDECRRGFSPEMVPPARQIPASYRWLPANGAQPTNLCDTHMARRAVMTSRSRHVARPTEVVMSA